MTSQQSRPPLAIEFLPQQPALDIIALMDALKIEKAVLAGFDWGARTAGALAAAVQGAGLGERLSDHQPQGEPAAPPPAGWSSPSRL
jgi:pimeloyl-ACP methyl ester carboxylesterase